MNKDVHVEGAGVGDMEPYSPPPGPMTRSRPRFTRGDQSQGRGRETLFTTMDQAYQTKTTPMDYHRRPTPWNLMYQDPGYVPDQHHTTEQGTLWTPTQTRPRTKHQASPRPYQDIPGPAAPGFAPTHLARTLPPWLHLYSHTLLHTIPRLHTTHHGLPTDSLQSSMLSLLISTTGKLFSILSLFNV